MNGRDAKAQDRAILAMAPYMPKLKRLFTTSLLGEPEAEFVLSQLPELTHMTWSGWIDARNRNDVCTKMLPVARRYWPSLTSLSLLGGSVSQPLLAALSESSLASQLVHLELNASEVPAAPAVVPALAAMSNLQTLLLQSEDIGVVKGIVRLAPRLTELSLFLPTVDADAVLTELLPCTGLVMLHLACKSASLEASTVAKLLHSTPEMVVLSLDVGLGKRFDWPAFFKSSLHACRRLTMLRVGATSFSSFEAEQLPVVPARVLADWLAASPVIQNIPFDAQGVYTLGKTNAWWFNYLDGFAIALAPGEPLPLAIVQQVLTSLHLQLPDNSTTAPGVSLCWEREVRLTCVCV